MTFKYDESCDEILYFSPLGLLKNRFDSLSILSRKMLEEDLKSIAKNYEPSLEPHSPTRIYYKVVREIPHLAGRLTMYYCEIGELVFVVGSEKLTELLNKVEA